MSVRNLTGLTLTYLMVCGEGFLVNFTVYILKHFVEKHIKKHVCSQKQHQNKKGKDKKKAIANHSSRGRPDLEKYRGRSSR